MILSLLSVSFLPLSIVRKNGTLTAATCCSMMLQLTKKISVPERTSAGKSLFYGCVGFRTLLCVPLKNPPRLVSGTPLNPKTSNKLRTRTLMPKPSANSSSTVFCSHFFQEWFVEYCTFFQCLQDIFYALSFYVWECCVAAIIRNLNYHARRC